MVSLAVIVIAGLLLEGCGRNGEGQPQATGKAETAKERPTCPTCGMYADMTPDWQARIQYKDGSVLHFDVPEHMLAFYVDPTKHKASDYQKRLENATAILVTDYETKKATDARSASFVIESDLKTPMGKGAIPFAAKEAAERFRKEHGGQILALDKFTPEIVAKIQ